MAIFLSERWDIFHRNHVYWKVDVGVFLALLLMHQSHRMPQVPPQGGLPIHHANAFILGFHEKVTVWKEKERVLWKHPIYCYRLDAMTLACVGLFFWMSACSDLRGTFNHVRATEQTALKGSSTWMTAFAKEHPALYFRSTAQQSRKQTAFSSVWVFSLSCLEPGDLEFFILSV